MLRTPRCHSASTTAFAIAGGAPTVADSPTPFAPIGWCGDGVTVLADLPGGRLDRRRQEVVHERAGQVVAVLVVGDLLVQRRREAHRQAAVDLAVDDHRVDDVAAVVDRDEAADLDLAGALVDVDDADVAAERERQVRRVVVVDRLEARLHPLRDGSCRPRRRSPGSSWTGRASP